MKDSPVVVLYTADGDAVTVIERGSEFILAAESTEVLAALVDIRTELKIMNKHLSKITEENITEQEVAEDIL